MISFMLVSGHAHVSTSAAPHIPFLLSRSCAGSATCLSNTRGGFENSLLRDRALAVCFWCDPWRRAGVADVMHVDPGRLGLLSITMLVAGCSWRMLLWRLAAQIVLDIDADRGVHAANPRRLPVACPHARCGAVAPDVSHACLVPYPEGAVASLERCRGVEFARQLILIVEPLQSSDGVRVRFWAGPCLASSDRAPALWMSAARLSGPPLDICGRRL